MSSTTAPRPDSVAQAIAQALAEAGLAPDTSLTLAAPERTCLSGEVFRREFEVGSPEPAAPAGGHATLMTLVIADDGRARLRIHVCPTCLRTRVFSGRSAGDLS